VVGAVNILNKIETFDSRSVFGVVRQAP
jgi:hypothetical protein